MSKKYIGRKHLVIYLNPNRMYQIAVHGKIRNWLWDRFFANELQIWDNNQAPYDLVIPPQSGSKETDLNKDKTK